MSRRLHGFRHWKMFVRWQHKTRIRETYLGRGRRGDVAWYASLVRAIYVRGGPPKQKFVAYLGSYLESDSVPDVVAFWDGVDRRLARLRLPLADRTKAVEAIERRLPRPTPRQVEAAEKRAARAAAMISKLRRPKRLSVAGLA